MHQDHHRTLILFVAEPEMVHSTCATYYVLCGFFVAHLDFRLCMLLLIILN